MAVKFTFNDTHQAANEAFQNTTSLMNSRVRKSAEYTSAAQLLKLTLNQVGLKRQDINAHRLSQIFKCHSH